MGKKGTLALVSLGCAKNAVDLQVMAGNLVKEGWSLSPDPDMADTVIVNTCAFIAAAREEAESEIRRALEMKRQGRYKRVVVAGCYPQRYPDAAAKFPGVDGWNGVPEKWVESKNPTLRFTGRAFAYLKIAEGCNHRCSYCAIPSIRGRYRSRPVASILREARALLESGCKELVIVAHDPMLYGTDFKKRGAKGKRTRLSDLLWKIEELGGDFWIRVMYSYPSEIDEDFVTWMIASERAVRYIDMPIQHTVPEVLVRMNRARAVDATLTAADVLREFMPDVTLRTTVMTGFPGETEARFVQLKSDLRRMQFDHLGAFAYSPEKGTKGALMRGRPKREVAEARARDLMEQQAQIWKFKAQSMVGKTFRALVVAPGVARMASQAPDVDGVTFIIGKREEGRGKSGEEGRGKREMGRGDVGDFVDVKILRAKGFDFEGEIVGGGR